MRFSVWPIVQQPAADFLATCRYVGATGWDRVWTSDHLMPSREPLDTPVLECSTGSGRRLRNRSAVDRRS